MFAPRKKFMVYVYCIYFILPVYFAVSQPPREKCSNTEIFLVRIFPSPDWIREFAE